MGGEKEEKTLAFLVAREWWTKVVVGTVVSGRSTELDLSETQGVASRNRTRIR